MSHDKVVLGSDFVIVPPFELGFLFDRHAVGVIRVTRWQGSLLVLSLDGIEFVREESLTKFLDAEGGGKTGEGEWEETQRLLERQSVGLEGQDLGTHSDLVRDFSMMGVTVLQEEHPIIPFEVVEEGDDVSVISVLVHGQFF